MIDLLRHAIGVCPDQTGHPSLICLLPALAAWAGLMWHRMTRRKRK